MGSFDDLIPKAAGAGAFSDLIPSQQPAQQTPFTFVPPTDFTTEREMSLPEDKRKMLEEGRKVQANLRGKTPQELGPTQSVRDTATLEAYRRQAPKNSLFARDIDEFGAAPEMGALNLDSIKASLAGNLITNSAELAGALSSQIEGSKISQDPEGNPLITMPSGGTFAINKPGLSGQDFVQFATRMLSFIPAGRISGMGTKQLAKGALASGGTETALQAGEAALGGEFNPGQVAIATGAAPVGQVFGEKVIAPAADKIIAKFSDIQAKKMLAKSAPSIDTLKGSARKIYSEIDNAGTKISSRAMNFLTKDIVSTLKKSGLDRDLHPKATALTRRLIEDSNKKLTVSEVDTLRKLASDVSINADPAEARLGAIAIDKVDDFLDKIKPSDLIGDKSVGGKLKEARKFWGRAKRAELVDEAMTLARDQASGFENGIRVQFRSLLRRIDKGKAKGFSKEEIAAMRSIVQGSNAANITKQLGKFGVSQDQATSTLMLGLGGAGGFALGGGVGAVAVPIIGTVSRSLSEKLTKGGAKFAESIVKSGPNSTRIVKEYLKHVPKSQRSTEELMELLMRPDVNLSAFKETGDSLIDNAVFFAKNLQKSATTATTTTGEE